MNIEIINIVGRYTVAIGGGFSFGIWQNNPHAGIFVFLLLVTFNSLTSSIEDLGKKK